MQKTIEFMQISFKQEVLIKNNLPNITYPVPVSALDDILASGGVIDFAYMLFWLQEYSSSEKEGWEALEPAMLRLSEIIAPANDDPIGNIHTPDFYLNVQPRDMSLEVISIIRGGRVLVAIRPALGFTIGITVFHPLDAKTIRYLIGMARHPHPSHGVNMRENNWEYALDMAAPKASSFYANSRGESYLSYWGKGLGVSHNGKVDPALKKYHNKKQLMPNIVAAQIGTYYERME